MIVCFILLYNYMLCYVILYYTSLCYIILNTFIVNYILCIYIYIILYNIFYVFYLRKDFFDTSRRLKRGIAWPMRLAPRWFQFCRLRLATVLTTTRSTHMSWTWKGQGLLERRRRGDFTGFHGGFDPESIWFQQSEDRLHKFIIW